MIFRASPLAALLFVLSLSLFLACTHEKEGAADPNEVNESVINLLATEYELLPEKEISKSLDFRVYAQYAMPTEKYDHGILGDQIEAEQLVVVVDEVFYEYKLPDDYVFEDIRPRLYDVDGDSELEFICIRTNINQGAGIAIYKIIDGELQEYAFVPDIGRSYRWLNIVAINDLDNNGTVDLVWIETPHIGGILKVASIEAGRLQVLSETSQYSNHKIGERNLCLSVLKEQSDTKVFYVPSQGRDKIVGFTFSNSELELREEIPLVLDFSETLASQYDFGKLIEEEDNCI